MTAMQRSGTGASVVSTAAAVGADVVVTEKHHGASSRMAVNNIAYATGNAGTTLPGGVGLFADTNGSWGNARCYGFVMRAGTMTDAQVADMRSWLAAKAGVTL